MRAQTLPVAGMKIRHLSIFLQCLVSGPCLLLLALSEQKCVMLLLQWLWGSRWSGSALCCAIWSKGLELGMRGKDESEGPGGTSQTSTVP